MSGAVWKVASLVLDLVAAGAEREFVIAQVREKELAGATPHEVSLWLAAERDRAIADITQSDAGSIDGGQGLKGPPPTDIDGSPL